MPPHHAVRTMTSPNAQCPHEQRPGTKVCLHCRHDEIEAARRHRRDVMSRAGVVAVVVGFVAIAGVAGASAIQARLSKSSPVSAEKREANRNLPERTGDSASRGFVVAQASSSARELAPLAPVIPEGRSDLGDSVF